MRIFAIAVASAVFAASSAAQAEKRLFIVDNDGGYGINRCLSSGAGCGSTAATAFCRSREFRHAVSYRKVDRDDVTGAVPTKTSGCRGKDCNDFLAIECTR